MMRVLLFATTALAFAQMRPPQIVILVGPPGSGKSVQANRLSKSLKVPAVSMESLVKSEIDKKTPAAKGLAGVIASGELIGDDAANEIMKTRLLRRDANRGFILDGYPTTEKQAQVFDQFLAEQSLPKPVIVILEAPDDVLRARMKARKRVDDTPENIERRIREYREIEKFTVTRYGADKAVRVDGTGSEVAVASSIAQQIEEAQRKKSLSVRP